MKEHSRVEEKKNGIVYCLDCNKKATSEEVLQRTKCEEASYNNK